MSRVPPLHGRHPHLRVRGDAGRTTDPRRGRPRTPGTRHPGQVPAPAPSEALCPGFCARCDRPTRLRLGAGIDTTEALCPDCRTAEQQDRHDPAAERSTEH
jgi:hypothetical protein